MESCSFAIYTPYCHQALARNFVSSQRRAISITLWVLAEVEMEIRSGTVLVMTLLMAGAAGLGTIPLFFTGKLSKEVAALANAVACGVMIACSFDLIHEGQPYGANLVIAGVVLGEKRLKNREYT